MKEKDLKAYANKLMVEKDIKDVTQLQDALKEILKEGVETLLKAEMDETLGYEKYSNEGEKTNYRNGTSKKTVRSDLGEVDISIPRDRNGEYEPQLIPKYSRDISTIDEKIISMYGKGILSKNIYVLLKN